MSVTLAQYNPPYASPGGATPFKAVATLSAGAATFTPTATVGPVPAKRLYLSDITLTNTQGAGATVSLAEGDGTDAYPIFVGSSATVQVHFSATREYRSGTVVATTAGTVNIAVQGTQQ